VTDESVDERIQKLEREVERVWAGRRRVEAELKTAPGAFMDLLDMGMGVWGGLNINYDYENRIHWRVRLCGEWFIRASACGHTLAQAVARLKPRWEKEKEKLAASRVSLEDLKNL